MIQSCGNFSRFILSLNQSKLLQQNFGDSLATQASAFSHFAIDAVDLGFDSLVGILLFDKLNCGNSPSFSTFLGRSKRNMCDKYKISLLI